jgi:hypothetical protein
MMAKNYFWLVAALALACFAPGVAAQVTSGTAFAVAPGLLITNQHVIAGCSSVDVIAADGRRTGSIVNADDQIDLALLRVSGIKGATARLRSPRNIRLGESVMVFGFPLAGSLSSSGNFTSGLVSALRGLKDTDGELQITAPVQPGNSGGPLMDASGLVIGVVQAKLDALRAAIATGDIPQNVNFAISLEVLANFLAKNRVVFRDGALSAPLDTARVAELAQSFTYRVECRGRSQQAGASPSIKQGRLPPCSGSYETATWTNCVGEFTSPSGAKYVGAFRNGMPNGQGTFTVSSGEFAGQKYVGAFRDGNSNGQGTITVPDGGKYVGTFRDGMPNGQGTYTFPNGGKYVGAFREGMPNGQGTYTFPNGAKYVGAFRDDKFHGQGTFTFSSGDKYVGEFKDGKENGQGTEYSPDGAILRSGIWEDGVFIKGR